MLVGLFLLSCSANNGDRIKLDGEASATHNRVLAFKNMNKGHSMYTQVIFL